ncbi:hypothetical protein HKD37_18G049824 [Glycine soja]
MTKNRKVANANCMESGDNVQPKKGWEKPMDVVHPHVKFTTSADFSACNMASIIMSFAPATGRVFAATAAKGAGGSKEEKGLLDWILGGLQKEDQLLETDPILKKVEEKNGGTTSNTGRNKNSVAVPQKKKGGFGGLFAKN